MSSTPGAAQGPADAHALGRRHGSAPGHGEGGPSSTRTIVGYGFWIYLLSDIVMFSAFFAAYAVLADRHDGGPGQRELFEQGRVAAETAALLLSSFTCGLANVAAERRAMGSAQFWLLVTGLLGALFLALEIEEFVAMAQAGAGPQRSAFLSAFFALVGLHGLHIGIGLLWLGTMMAQLWAKGFQPAIRRRLMCFNLFWHALDIIWVGIFTIVYLIGVT